MKSSFRIRDMVPDDYPVYDRFESSLHRMHQEARPDLFKPCEHPFSQERFQSQLTDGSTQIFLAETEDGIPLGMCVLEIHHPPKDHPLICGDPCGYISDLFVSPEARRQGLATALYQESVRRSKAAGARRLELMVWPFNKGASAFYERMGLSVRSYNLEIKL